MGELIRGSKRSLKSPRLEMWSLVLEGKCQACGIDPAWHPHTSQVMHQSHITPLRRKVTEERKVGRGRDGAFRTIQLGGERTEEQAKGHFVTCLWFVHSLHFI